MKHVFLTVFTIVFFTFNVKAQSVGVNTTGASPDISSMLDVQSSSKGILIPRMSMIERQGIFKPANGLLVYDTDSDSFWFFQSGVWNEIKSDNNAVFKKSGTTVSPASGYATDDFVFGSESIPLTGITKDTMFFFKHEKSAYRGGRVSNSAWQPSDIGTYSFAHGFNVRAQGIGGTAFGLGSSAFGNSSFAVGNDASASGENAVAMGSVVSASGQNAIALGQESSASGDFSIAMGQEAESDLADAVAIGKFNKAEGVSSLALGSSNLASGNYSTALGLFNEPIVLAGTTLKEVSPILTVGNGSSNNLRSNAMTILKNGNVGIGTDTPNGLLAVDGAIVIGSTAPANPSAGSIRYLGSNFQGFDGTSWNEFSTSDNQTLSIQNNELSISGGNTVTLSSSGSSDEILDADGDTKVLVEESTDDDIIRFDIAGEEQFMFKNGGSGDARMEMNNANENILIGLNAGNANGAAAVGNVFVGSESGALNNNGSFNSFLGTDSGKNNTSGGFNTLIGAQAGLFKQSGSSNVFLGFSAGENNLSGSGNVFIGTQVSIPGNASNRLAIHNAGSIEETEALVYGEFDNSLLRVNGQLEIKDEYRFPEVNGLPNQALVTDANGNLTWVSIDGVSGGSGLPSASRVITTPSSSAFNNAEGGRFGDAVAISGDFISVGAQFETSFPTGQNGHTHLFKNNGMGWSQTDFWNGNNTETRNFGISTSMDNNNIAVGSDNGVTTNRGRLYYYSYNSNGDVVALDNIQSSDIAANDKFGSKVALSGNYIAVGAPAKSSNQGGAYVFRYNGSSLVQEDILSVAGSSGFGTSIDIDGNYMIVGAPNTINSGSTTGKAYIYIRSGTSWSLQYTVNSFGGRTGQEVSIQGDKVVVSSIPVSTVGGSGSIQVLKRIGGIWSIEQNISPIDGQDRDEFGTSTAIFGDKLVVGAPFVDYNGNNTGAVYAYEFDGSTWQFVKKHIHPNYQINDNMGLSIDYDGTTFVAGGGNNTKIFIEQF